MKIRTFKDIILSAKKWQLKECSRDWKTCVPLFPLETPCNSLEPPVNPCNPMWYIVTINPEKTIFHVLYRKQAFLDYENVGLKTPQNIHFSKGISIFPSHLHFAKGVSPSLSSKVWDVLYFHFMQNIPRKVPENVLVRKTFFCNPLYPHVIHREKTIDKPYIGLKNLHYLLVHGFCQNLRFWQLFVLKRFQTTTRNNIWWCSR